MSRWAGRILLAAIVTGALTLGGGGCGSRTGLYVPDVDAGVDEGRCEGGELGSTPEVCNGIDDDCDGSVDEGFGVGEACDGPDSDVCVDDLMSCSGCSRGPDTREICNGVDDDCDGVVDADCESGDCSPKLIVTGSIPSNPDCLDFPVEPGSSGQIQYPCGGGPVTAQLGRVSFTGRVDDGIVSLQGTETFDRDQSPDGCVWQMTHHITGTVGSGQLAYDYAEVIENGRNCWFPCTETGTVRIQWLP